MDGDEDIDDDESDNGEPMSRMSQLLCINRQIFEEAGPILYPKTFYFEDTTALHHFLSAVGPCKRKFIEKLVIQGYGHTKSHKAYNHPALSLLKDLPDLKYFEIDCRIDAYTSRRQNQMVAWARQFFRDGFRWFQCVDGAIDKLILGENAMSGYQGESQEENQKIFVNELRRLVQKL